MAKPVKLCHFDVVVSGGAEEKNFYEEIFDWSIVDSESSNCKLIITKPYPNYPSEVIGSLWNKPFSTQSKDLLVPFFEVENVGATYTKAVEYSTEVTGLVPPQAYPDPCFWGTEYAVFRAPKGELVAIIQKLPQS